MTRCILSVLFAGLFCASMPTLAATLTVKGSVTQPPCTVNGGATIKVNFGDDIMTTRIDGVAYKKQPLNYTIECEGDMSGYSALAIQIKGTAASFGSGLLQTNKTGLGVQFLAAGSNLALNTGSAGFDYLSGSPPAIEAVLARDPSVTLTGGDFTATATMYVNYQ
ncbi:fimbrial protein [Klebsiella aerogenes]|uniref:fimbrial protein n=1 Tax=Klebsiella aerogenes TaxID=548 RepID=UPI002E366129|nr:fimbrial protein [Klebsiella aerogenes]